MDKWPVNTKKVDDATDIVLGKEQSVFGSSLRDSVIRTKGKVKIQVGRKFVDLFDGERILGGSKAITIVDNPNKIPSTDGFYYSKDDNSLYLSIGGEVIKIFGEGELDGKYISFTKFQDLTDIQRDQAKQNIGTAYDTQKEALNKHAGNGLIFIKSENKAYILNGGIFYPITNNTKISGDQIEDGEDIDRYFFDKTVTISIGGGSGPSLKIVGLGDKYSIQFGDTNNNMNIYQSPDGGVVDSDNSLDLKVDGNSIIRAEGGQVNINGVLKVIKSIISDKIHSSGFIEGDRGFGLWIDSSTGESYLQVDHILGQKTEYIGIKYVEALVLMRTAKIKPGKHYVIIDYQNEWEATPEDDVMGEDLWDQIFEGEEEGGEPKFGVDRNVRPIVLESISNKSFGDEVTYYYNDDQKDIVRMLYDIRMKELPLDEDGDIDVDDLGDLYYENRGRIYYMQDIWLNEAPCDFKHFINDKKQYIFNKDNKDASSLNTLKSMVCAGNKILDPGVKVAEKVNPLIMTGKSILNNTLAGRFEEVVIGDNNSIIENNYFNGDIKKCKFLGEFTNNSIGCTMEECEFKKKVSNNEFNKDFKKCVFYNEVVDNIFDMSFEECNFTKITSNQFTGSSKKCEFYNPNKLTTEIKENQFMGDFLECKWLGNVSSNDMKVNTIEKCVFKIDMVSNRINGDLWQECEFKDTVKNNTFQADVIKLICGGLLNNNNFMGRINDVIFFKDESNKDYGLNNNIINGLFTKSKFYVDFSHNVITGPISELVVNAGTPGEDKKCMFNYNNITAASIGVVTVNHDFRRNDIKAEYFGQLTFNGVFSHNSFNYYNMRIATHNRMYGCIGKGKIFVGTFAADFDNCEFADIETCTFRAAPIKFAKFRESFKPTNFDVNTGIQDLEKLYDPKHQVDVYRHMDKIVVFCAACNVPKKGEIKMWSGKIEDIPEGWHICDGTEGTPNLIGSFIKADKEAGKTGGGDELTLTVDNLPTHGHEIVYETITSNSIGVEPSGDDLGSATFNLDGEALLHNGGTQYHWGEEGDTSTDRAFWGRGNTGWAKIKTLFETMFTGAKASETGGGKPIKFEPKYYSLIFIMKL